MNVNTGLSSAIEAAIALANTGRLDEAEALAKQALAGDPGNPDALNVLGGLARARGDRDAAIRFYSEAVRQRPDHAKAEGNLGATLLESGRIDEALHHLRAAIKRVPLDNDARVNLGTALAEAGDYSAAEAELRDALRASPTDALALNSLGNALFHLGRIDAAIAVFEDAVRHEPTLAMAFNNLASAWREKGNLTQAEGAFRRAIALRPDLAAAWTGLGVVLREQGRFGEARAAHDRALDIAPSFASALFNRAVIDLGDGRFAQGFRDYRARPLEVAPGIERQALPADLSRSRVLLLPNQGLGDELFFLRFAPALRSLGAVLIYRASPAIAGMVARSGAVDLVLTDGDDEPDHDLAVSIGDLPFLLNVEVENDLPPALALPALAEERAKAEAQLAALGPPPYLGLTWRAGSRDWNALLKQIPLDALGHALRDVPATFLALQRAPDSGEIAALSKATGTTIHDLSAWNGALEAMLALLHTIHGYVAVSNTNTHLRAGTGRPAHILVPHPPEWRWMAEGARSPWFPHFPLYRQVPPSGGDSGWESALTALRRDILASLSKGS